MAEQQSYKLCVTGSIPVAPIWEEGEIMVNIRGMMKKLQRAILCTGLVVKINTYQLWSDEQKRIINVFTVSTPIFSRKKSGEWVTKDYEIIRSSSGIDVINCLSEIYKAVREWA